MGKFHYSVHINASPEEVFQVASNIPNAANMIEGITKIEMLTDGPVGVGTTWSETRVMFGKEHSETMEITGFDPPRSYTVGSESCGALWSSTFSFTPEAGGTRVDLDFLTKPLSVWAKIMSVVMTPLMRGMMKKCVGADLRDLKKVCEGGAASEGQPAAV